jgi:hypothetical protein
MENASELQQGATQAEKEKKKRCGVRRNSLI